MTKGRAVHPGVPGRRTGGHGAGGEAGVRTPWKCSRLCGLTLSPDGDVDARGDASQPAPLGASSCVQVRRPPGLFSWSVRSVGLTATLIQPVATPLAWHSPGLSLCGPAQTTLYEVIQAAQSYTCSSINLALPLNMPSVDPASCLEPRLLPDSLWRESPVLWSTDAPLHWTRRELCPLCGPHCGSVMSTFDSCEQPKSCPCVIRRACVSPIRG